MLTITSLLLYLWASPVLLYTKNSNDYDLYGIKVTMNDRLVVSIDNVFSIWYVTRLPTDVILQCTMSFNLTTCDFGYSVALPVATNNSFVYNCIDLQGNNIIGVLVAIDPCTYQLDDEQIVSNYLTQDNFIIAIDGEDAGVYGFADDFVFFYQLQPTYQLTVWPNTLGISPRSVDIGFSIEYAVVVGYCQLTLIAATECGFVVRLYRSLSSPNNLTEFTFPPVSLYPWSDPRRQSFRRRKSGLYGTVSHVGEHCLAGSTCTHRCSITQYCFPIFFE